jgi:hypothetical protein
VLAHARACGSGTLTGLTSTLMAAVAAEHPQQLVGVDQVTEGIGALSGAASRGRSRLHIVDPAPEPFGMFGRCPADCSANLILRLAFSHFGAQGPERIDGGEECWRVQFAALTHGTVREACCSPTGELVGRRGPLRACGGGVGHAANLVPRPVLIKVNFEVG